MKKKAIFIVLLFLTSMLMVGFASSTGKELDLRSGPVLSYDPRSYWVNLQVGETDETVFNIWNSGDGLLEYTITDTVDWVSVYPSSGSIEGNAKCKCMDLITVTIDTSGLIPGSYKCPVTILTEDGQRGTFLVYVQITGDVLGDG